MKMDNNIKYKYIPYRILGKDIWLVYVKDIDMSNMDLLNELRPIIYQKIDRDRNREELVFVGYSGISNNKVVYNCSETIARSLLGRNLNIKDMFSI